MTIADLKKKIKDLPDDMLVLVPGTGSEYDFVRAPDAYVKKVDWVSRDDDEDVEEKIVLLINN